MLSRMDGHCGGLSRSRLDLSPENKCHSLSGQFLPERGGRFSSEKLGMPLRDDTGGAFTNGVTSSLAMNTLTLKSTACLEIGKEKCRRIPVL